MKPVRKDGPSFVLLTMPGGDESQNLPATRVLAFNPDKGETEEDAVEAIETTWEPDEGELRALTNGAPIVLTVWGTGHPPVALEVGEPDMDGAVAVLVKAHVDRAVGFFFAALSKHLAEGSLPPADEVLELWHTALEDTRDLDDVDLRALVEANLGEIREKIGEAPNGNGHAPEEEPEGK